MLPFFVKGSDYGICFLCMSKNDGITKRKNSNLNG